MNTISKTFFLPTIISLSLLALVWVYLGIGAFAILSSLPIIIIGLGIGAYFVRVLTVYLVRQKTLNTLRYIEHGAHWAILGLVGSMLLSLFVEVFEVIIGLMGIMFMLVALYFFYPILKRSKLEPAPTSTNDLPGI